MSAWGRILVCVWCTSPSVRLTVAVSEKPHPSVRQRDQPDAGGEPAGVGLQHSARGSRQGTGANSGNHRTHVRGDRQTAQDLHRRRPDNNADRPRQCTGRLKAMKNKNRAVLLSARSRNDPATRFPLSCLSGAFELVPDVIWSRLGHCNNWRTIRDSNS